VYVLWNDQYWGYLQSDLTGNYVCVQGIENLLNAGVHNLSDLRYLDPPDIASLGYLVGYVLLWSRAAILALSLIPHVRVFSWLFLTRSPFLSRMSLVDRKKLEKFVHELEESVHESCARVPEQTEVALAEIGFVVQVPGHRLE